MEKSNKSFSTIDEYILLQPEEVRPGLDEIRQVIKKNAPEAEETISYQMPAFKFHGILVYFAAFKNHYSLFPASRVIEVFKPKLKEYSISKGTIQFPFGKPLPVELIAEIVTYRVKENLEKIQMKDLAKQKKSKK
jgi:uncharacterized protein YdhG (YjbR/CyaY superfamily)